jgi:hypothetical protein
VVGCASALGCDREVMVAASGGGKRGLLCMVVRVVADGGLEEEEGEGEG